MQGLSEYESYLIYFVFLLDLVVSKIESIGKGGFLQVPK